MPSHLVYLFVPEPTSTPTKGGGGGPPSPTLRARFLSQWPPSPPQKALAAGRGRFRGSPASTPAKLGADRKLRKLATHPGVDSLPTGLTRANFRLARCPLPACELTACRSPRSRKHTVDRRQKSLASGQACAHPFYGLAWRRLGA